MSRLVFATIVFSALWLTSTIINGNEVKMCFYDGCSLIFIAMACDYYKDRFYMLIVAFALAFSFCTYLNFLYMLAHPELWIIDDMKMDQGYLLGGNYNGMGCRLLCAVGISMACLKYSKWWLLNVIPVALVSIVTLVFVESMTSLTGVLLFLLFCLIPSRKLIKTGIVSLLGIVFLFQVLICFQGKGIEQNPFAVYIIEDVLGKDITFTYRTYLWDAAAKIFVNSPLYGYGYVDRDWYYSHMSAIAMGPHNYIWAVLVTGGILLLAILTYICFLSFSKLFTTSDRHVLLIYAVAAVLFLMMLMENYPHLLLFTLLALTYFAPRSSIVENPKTSVAQIL
jgi:O-antigen ligase